MIKWDVWSCSNKRVSDLIIQSKTSTSTHE